MFKKIPTIDSDKYQGEWIALNPKTDKVVAHSRSLVEAEKAAKEKGIARPLMYAVPKQNAIFVGGNIHIVE